MWRNGPSPKCRPFVRWILVNPISLAWSCRLLLTKFSTVYSHVLLRSYSTFYTLWSRGFSTKRKYVIMYSGALNANVDSQPWFKREFNTKYKQVDITRRLNKFNVLSASNMNTGWVFFLKMYGNENEMFRLHCTTTEIFWAFDLLNGDKFTHWKRMTRFCRNLPWLEVRRNKNVNDFAFFCCARSFRKADHYEKDYDHWLGPVSR